jgi:DNA topoisomerase IA
MSQVKKLEELGIGRPSTYASTLRVLQVFDSGTLSYKLRSSIIINVLKTVKSSGHGSRG